MEQLAPMSPPLPESRLGDYFANRPKDEIVGELQRRTQDYYRYLRTSGKLARWERSYRYYYSADERGMSAERIGRSGSQGELSTMRVNHYRSLTQSLLTLTTSQPPAYEVRSVTTDYQAQSQTLIGQALLDYYVREGKLGRVLKETAEFCMTMDEGWLYSPWDQNIGEEFGVDPESRRVVRKGDLRYEAKAPVDVVRDTRARGGAASPKWVIVRSWANKHDLAAEHPERADDILSVSDMRSGRDEDSFLINREVDHEATESDLVPYWEFWHDQTSAVPAGRYVKYVGDIPLEDETLDALEYESIPLSRMAASDQAFTVHGYSNQLDLLAIQEAVDQLYSTVLTNQATFGTQSIIVRKGSGLNPMSVGGLNFLEIAEGVEEPKALQLTETPAEIFNFIQQLEQVMEKLSGVNSTVRGDPQANLKSGAALALVASQAIQLMGNINNAYDELFEAVGNQTFKLLQRRATVPRLVAIVGKFNRSYLTEFTAKDISHVSKVVVDKGNYLTRMAAGRVELANTLLGVETDAPMTRAEYLTVIATGRLEPMTEAPMAELLNIRAENEALRDGKPVKAIRGDAHALHKAEHRSVIASPEARTNPELLAAVTAHLQEHEELEQIEAAPPAPPPGPPPAPGGNAAGALQVPPMANPAVPAAGMPTNPLTGAPYQPGS